MSYTPTVWKAGDTVTSTKLNKLENGIANNGILVANINYDTQGLDKTWQEIYDAKFCIICNSHEDNNIQGKAYYLPILITNENSEYTIAVFDPLNSENIILIANSADEYPVYQEGASELPESPPYDPPSVS